MGSSILDAINSAVNQASHQATSALGSMPKFGSSSLLWLLGFLLLAPLLGIFIRPLFGLLAVITHSIASIVGIIITCISSWVILLFRYLIEIAHALAPSPLLQPYIRGAIVVGGAFLLLKHYTLPWYYLAGAALIPLAVAFGNNLSHHGKIPPPAHIWHSSAGKIAICLGAISLAAVCIMGLHLGSRHNSASCLVGGSLQQSCIDKLQRERF